MRHNTLFRRGAALLTLLLLLTALGGARAPRTNTAPRASPSWRIARLVKTKR